MNACLNNLHGFWINCVDYIQYTKSHSTKSGRIQTFSQYVCKPNLQSGVRKLTKYIIIDGQIFELPHAKIQPCSHQL